MQTPPSPQRLEADREALSSTPSFRRRPDDDSPMADEPRRSGSHSLHDGLDAAAQPVEGNNVFVKQEEEEEEEEEFEFAVFPGGVFGGGEPVAADEIFSNGQIRPLYPLFDRALVLDAPDGPQADAAGGATKRARLPLRKLMMDDRDPPSTPSSSAASSESDELEGIPADSYCVWTPRLVPPSPDQLRKRSHSTGYSSSCSSSRRWRLRDLVIGRSHSDGRKKFVFLAAPQAAGDAAEKAGKKQSLADSPASAVAAVSEGKKKSNGRVLEMDMVTAHRIYYSKGAAAAAAGDRRQSFLPYRKNLVGFHPF